MMAFIVSPEAAQDLEDIWDIADDSVDAADRFLDELQSQIMSRVKTPLMGHPRKDLAEGRSILFWPSGKYLIIHRIKNEKLEVVAVTQGGRDIPAFLRRRVL